MTLVRLGDYEPDPRPFLIDGLLDAGITGLSGKPKSGKSALAAHMGGALARGDESFLGRPLDGRRHGVYWAGSDSGWRRELNERWKTREGCMGFLHEKEGEEPRLWTPQQWKEKGDQLAQEGVTIAILDHLYGFSSGGNLNHSHEVQPFFDRIRDWPDTHGIAVVVLAHAGKGWSDGAAHSYAIEAECRHLLGLSGDGRATKRTLSVSGNSVDPQSMDIRVTPLECLLLAAHSPGGSTRNRQSKLPDRARKLLGAGPEALASQAAAGRWLHAHHEVKSDKSGRTMVRNMIKGDLLDVGGDGSIIAGSNLNTEGVNT